jgi:streptogramin lyase
VSVRGHDFVAQKYSQIRVSRPEAATAANAECCKQVVEHDAENVARNSNVRTSGNQYSPILCGLTCFLRRIDSSGPIFITREAIPSRSRLGVSEGETSESRLGEPSCPHLVQHSSQS